MKSTHSWKEHSSWIPPHPPPSWQMWLHLEKQKLLDTDKDERQPSRYQLFVLPQPLSKVWHTFFLFKQKIIWEQNKDTKIFSLMKTHLLKRHKRVLHAWPVFFRWVCFPCSLPLASHIGQIISITKPHQHLQEPQGGWGSTKSRSSFCSFC